MSDIDPGQAGVPNLRSNYLPSFYHGSIAWPGGTYHQTRRFSVLVLERALITNTFHLRVGSCALTWGDGSGPVGAIFVEPVTDDPMTYVYPLNVSIAFGGTLDFSISSGDFSVALAAYWTPYYDNA